MIPISQKNGKITIITRALPVSSRTLGVSGECDIVEFQRVEDGIRLHGHRGLYHVLSGGIQERKAQRDGRGSSAAGGPGQCLEEMFSTDIPEGAIFYGETRRREIVPISAQLRKEVAAILEEMHQYYERGYTPEGKISKSCSACSLRKSVSRNWEEMFLSKRT